MNKEWIGGAKEDFAMMEKALFMRMHLLTMRELWSLHYSLASKTTPRNLNLLALRIRWPFRKRRGSSPGLYERVNETNVDLGAENLSFHLRPHLATFSIYG